MSPTLPGLRAAPGLWLFALAAVVRSAYVLAVADHPAVRFPIGDSLAYHTAALRILDGDWLGNEVFYQDPLYPYLLALLYGVFGAGSIGVLIAQALLDSVSVVLIYFTARALFDARAAAIAGVLAALFRVAWFYDAILLKVPLTLLLASLTAYLLVRADARRSWVAWFWAAMALGLAALTRGNYLVFVPILVLWLVFVVPRSGPGPRLRSLAALGAGLVITIGPVAFRNYLVADDFVLITSQAGQNFYIGNHRENDSGVYKAPAFVISNAAHEQKDFREEAERRTGRSFKPSELSNFWFREAFSDIAADPAHFGRHTLRKLRLFFNHYEIPDNQSFAFFAQHVTGLLAIPTPGYGVLLPLAVCGVWLARRKRSAWLLVLFFASYAASVVLFFNVSRYRIPALPAVFVFAGYAISQAIELAKRRDYRAVVIPAALLVVGFWVTQADLIDEDFALFRSNLGAAHSRRAAEHRQLAREMYDAGDPTGARREQALASALWDSTEEQYRKGLDIQPHNQRLRGALKSLLEGRTERAKQDDRLDVALDVAQRLTATFPRYAVGFVVLGEVHEARGELPRAEWAMSRAMSISAGNRARAGLARVRRAMRGEGAGETTGLPVTP
ncbi:MAG: glycosyltransferase family 39 protein [Myxococcota bacterium]